MHRYFIRWEHRWCYVSMKVFGEKRLKEPIYGFFLSCVCYACVCVCLFVPSGHLLGKRWPLGPRLCCITVNLSISHRYPGWGMALNCIDSWSLHPYLLSICISVLNIDLVTVGHVNALQPTHCFHPRYNQGNKKTFINRQSQQIKFFYYANEPFGPVSCAVLIYYRI